MLNDDNYYNVAEMNFASSKINPLPFAAERVINCSQRLQQHSECCQKGLVVFILYNYILLIRNRITDCLPL